MFLPTMTHFTCFIFRWTSSSLFSFKSIFIIIESFNAEMFHFPVSNHHFFSILDGCFNVKSFFIMNIITMNIYNFTVNFATFICSRPNIKFFKNFILIISTRYWFTISILGCNIFKILNWWHSSIFIKVISSW
jgi:hypothetical protein